MYTVRSSLVYGGIQVFVLGFCVYTHLAMAHFGRYNQYMPSHAIPDMDNRMTDSSTANQRQRFSERCLNRMRVLNHGIKKVRHALLKYIGAERGHFDPWTREPRDELYDSAKEVANFVRRMGADWHAWVQSHGYVPHVVAIDRALDQIQNDMTDLFGFDVRDFLAMAERENRLRADAIRLVNGHIARSVTSYTEVLAAMSRVFNDWGIPVDITNDMMLDRESVSNILALA
jgi:hypothetical protein